MATYSCSSGSIAPVFFPPERSLPRLYSADSLRIEVSYLHMRNRLVGKSVDSWLATYGDNAGDHAPFCIDLSGNSNGNYFAHRSQQFLLFCFRCTLDEPDHDDIKCRELYAV